MAHEIDFTKGMPAIAYRGRKPWHGYGQVIDEDLPIDQWQTLAGLNWEVERKAVRYYEDINSPLSLLRTVPRKTVLVRSDTKDALSVVSDRYKVVQPIEVLQFFKDLIEEQGFEMNTAGALREGRRIWALAKTGKDFTIDGDRVAGYLLLATAYDGTFSTTAQFTSIRVVCNNTLGFSLARGGEGGIVKIPHTQDFVDWDVKGRLGLSTSWTQFRSNVETLIDTRISKEEAIEYFLTVCGVTEEEAADGKQLYNVKKLLAAYEKGPGAKLPTAKDTLWGAVNAVTYITDHTRRASNAGARFDSASFGGGAKFKQSAFDTALKIAEAA